MFSASSMFGFLEHFFEEGTRYQRDFSTWKASLVASLCSEEPASESTDLNVESKVDPGIHCILLSVQRVMARHKEKHSAMTVEGKINELELQL